MVVVVVMVMTTPTAATTTTTTTATATHLMMVLHLISFLLCFSPPITPTLTVDVTANYSLLFVV